MARQGKVEIRQVSHSWRDARSVTLGTGAPFPSSVSVHVEVATQEGPGRLFFDIDFETEDGGRPEPVLVAIRSALGDPITGAAIASVPFEQLFRDVIEEVGSRWSLWLGRSSRLLSAAPGPGGARWVISTDAELAEEAEHAAISGAGAKRSRINYEDLALLNRAADLYREGERQSASPAAYVAERLNYARRTTNRILEEARTAGLLHKYDPKASRPKRQRSTA
jgi:hypothetical protein